MTTGDDRSAASRFSPAVRNYTDVDPWVGQQVVHRLRGAGRLRGVTVVTVEDVPTAAPAEPGTAPPRTGGRLGRVITGLIGIAVVVAILVFLLPNATTYEEAVAQLTDVGAGWMMGLAVACLVNIVAYPFTVLVAVQRLTYPQGFVERQSGFLVSNTIPGGGAVAVGTQYAILGHYRVPAALSAAAVSADAVWTYLLTLGMPSLGVALLVLEGRQNTQLTTIAVVGIAACLLSLAGIVAVLHSETAAWRLGRWAQRVSEPVLRRLHRPAPDLPAAFMQFHDTAADLISRRWAQLTVTNVVAQTTPLLVLFCALGGVGAFPGELSAIEVFAAYSAAILLTSFPITPGGLVTVDAALVGLLIAFGAQGSEAVAADLLWRLVWFLPQLLVGGAALLWYLYVRHRDTPTVAPAEG